LLAIINGVGRREKIFIEKGEKTTKSAPRKSQMTDDFILREGQESHTKFAWYH
jgi:hypothetical protein